MIKLIESELFGHNLVDIYSPSLVKRYNECLEDIGLAPTKLKQFHIDGWGWSPQIAEEQDDRFYLSHGLANPYGIIITPKQEDSAIYMPYHSFDRQIHQKIFKHYKDQITDITTRSGLWFELDQEITAYRSPQDLLMIDYIKVNFYSVDRIMLAAQKQRELISEFYDKPNAWSNDDLRKEIIESCKKHGDLRYMKLDIPTHPFNEIDTFHTVAFDGLYVFKKLKNNKPLLVYGGNKTSVSGETKHGHIEYNIKDPSLVSYLYNAGLISNDLSIYAQFPAMLDLMQEQVLLSAISASGKKYDYISLNKNQKKGLINKLLQDGHLPDVYFEFERLIGDVRDGKNINADDLPQSLFPYLLNPKSHLNQRDKKVLWKMLSNINDSNPVITYLFDKSKFYTDYQSWDDQTQQWIIDKILKHKDIYNHLIQ